MEEGRQGIEEESTQNSTKNGVTTTDVCHRYHRCLSPYLPPGAGPTM